MQKSVAEHALGVLKNKLSKAAFFNFIISVTKDCDCFSSPNMRKIINDIGIVASTDPVAVDKASVDLVETKAGKKLTALLDNDNLDTNSQIEHAQRIGLGTTKYELIEVS